MISKHADAILVWDCAGEAPSDQVVFYWTGHYETDNHRSILNILEENSNLLRDQYLTFVQDLGQLKVGEKKIVDHLEVEPGFSLWWMSIIAEKSPWKSDGPLNCLRLMALAKVVKEKRPSSIELVSRNSNLAEGLAGLCESLSVKFIWHSTDQQEKNWISSIFSHVTRVSTFLGSYVVKRWALRKVRVRDWFPGKDAIFIFSYFFNLDQRASNLGKFYSSQWGVLPELVNSSGKRVNFIHHFLIKQPNTTTSTGIKWIQSFNNDAENQGLHSFLDSYVTATMIVRSVSFWIRQIIPFMRLGKSIEKEMKQNPVGWIWPFLRCDWAESAWGATAIRNVLWVRLFDRSMALLPRQRLGLYLCENHGWERAFIFYWRKYGHGRLIAVAHVAVRYWDLRYFDMGKVSTEKNSDVCAQPIPDKIAVHGQAALEILSHAHQPTDRFVEVEALRYLQLEKINSINVELSQNSDGNERIRVLILGEIKSDSFQFSLRVLEELDENLWKNFALVLKPHPGNPTELGTKLESIVTVTSAPLDQLLRDCDLVISSNATTSAVEGFMLGLPVITILGNQDFNLSPLRGESGVCFVRNASELRRALDDFSVKPNLDRRKDFFWTNSDLRRWKALLDLEENCYSKE
jgi:surface carbohydrate biosynthesis protein (TIGR04326 family)